MNTFFLRNIFPLLILLAVLLMASFAVNANPMFARQTALACGHCHAPAPSLTPFGRRFMLNGFTLSSLAAKLPPVSIVSTTVMTSINKSPQPASNVVPFDSVELQQLSGYFGGKLSDNVGSFMRADYDGFNKKLSIGDVDVRRIANTEFMEKNILTGISLNNNPSQHDPWNSNPARAWPYFISALEQQPANRVVLDGVLANRVVGLGGYAFIDDSLYLEVAGYQPLGADSLNSLGISAAGRRMSGPGIYLRVAKEFLMPSSSFTVGATSFTGDIQKSYTSAATAQTQDFSLDALYQKQSGPHYFTVAGNVLRETVSTSNDFQAGSASFSSNNLTRFYASANYMYSQMVGVGVGYSSLKGSGDRLYFQTNNGQPDTTSYRVDMYWNPISTSPPKWYPWVRTRLGIQHVHYTSFNGATDNYDGRGRSASDNDATTLYWILVF